TAGAIVCFMEPQAFRNPDISPIDARPAGAARREEDRRRLIATYDHAGIGIVETDAEGLLLRVNAHLAKMLGYTPDQLVGSSIFERTHPEDVEADREQFRRQVAGEIDSYKMEKRFVREDGSIAWAVVSSSSVRDADGRFLYAVRVQHDISERKRIEDELAKRAEEQAALQQFTQRLQHARSLGDIHNAALDAV